MVVPVGVQVVLDDEVVFAGVLVEEGVGQVASLESGVELEETCLGGLGEGVGFEDGVVQRGVFVKVVEGEDIG